MGIDLFIEKPEVGYGVGQTISVTESKGIEPIYISNKDDIEKYFEIISDRVFSTRFDFWLSWLDDEVFIRELFIRSFREDGIRKNGTSIVEILCALYLSCKMQNPLRETYRSWIKADVETDFVDGRSLPLEYYNLAIAAINEDFPGAF